MVKSLASLVGRVPGTLPSGLERPGDAPYETELELGF
jgi:hypothetical protein